MSRDYPPRAEPVRAIGRTRKYGLWRACERVSPIDLFGEPLGRLTHEQQNDLMNYGLLRQMEESK